MTQLSTHQNEVFEDVISILRTSRNILIKGSAGTGKTFMVNTLIKSFPSSSKKKIYCTAPTNKAVGVLRSKVDSREDITFATVHSAMKLKRSIHYKTGEVSFKPSFNERYPPLSDASYLIIDEVSMLNSSLLGFIETYSDMFNVKVIYIGDSKQLPPVGEKVSPIFEMDYPEVELTEIVRQAKGNSIIEISRNLNRVNSKVSKFIEVDGEKKGYLFSNDQERVLETLARVNGTNELKYLAYTNREVDKINKLVRERIYGVPKKIEVGESLIFNVPYKQQFFTNDEIKVESFAIEKRNFKYKSDKFGSEINEPGESPMYQYVALTVYLINPTLDSDGKVDSNVIIIHESSETQYQKVIKLLRDKALTSMIDWVDRFEFIEKFADVKYNHAITVHKSQGSTFKQVIINTKDLNINRDKSEREKLMYTGVTRASDLLILYNP